MRSARVVDGAICPTLFQRGWRLMGLSVAMEIIYPVFAALGEEEDALLSYHRTTAGVRAFTFQFVFRPGGGVRVNF